MLKRRHGERIYIGDTVVVTVKEIDRGKVKIGIDAPRSVNIARDEVLTESERQELDRLRHEACWRANQGGRNANA